ncbi:MAG: DUF541 domain-containing protein [Gemmatimonas sp.]|nr:DUF541 domain-containing protein [Gemmatimonas sp.]
MNRRMLPVAMGLIAWISSGSDTLSAQVGTPVIGDQRTIRASGVGEVTVQSDMATIQFAVETTGTTAQEAAGANADLMDAVIGALRGAGVGEDQIETSQYSLFPEYARPPRGSDADPPVIRGYRASNQVAIESTDLEGLGELIDVGLAAGANRVNGVMFDVIDPAASKSAALSDAVANARASAETIASALGVQLGEVLDASTNADPVRPVFRAVAAEAMEMDAAAAALTPIEPGEQTVSAVASVVFAIQ